MVILTRRTTAWIIALVVIVGLAIDAYEHFAIASWFSFHTVKGGLSESTLFRAQAVVSIVFGVLLLIWRNRTTYLLAFLVLASAVGALLLYGYVNVGAIGPLPNMYDPVWYSQKTICAIAEGIGAIAAVVGFVGCHVRARSTVGSSAQEPDRVPGRL
jgi:hypothetical protein